MNQRNIAVSLECFVKKNGKYLMLHRSPKKRIMPDVWMAPGGHLEFNEGLFEAAKREIKEETGLEIKNIKVKAIGTAFLKDLNQELFFHFVTADYKKGELLQEKNNGILAWLTPEEISKLPTLLAEIRKILHYIFTENNKIISYKAVYEKGNIMTKFYLEKP